MILVDTSIWVDHLRKGDPAMQQLLDHGDVLSHPLVIGELAMGDLRPRQAILDTLRLLPTAISADQDEALQFISLYKLYGIGIGYIDAHLLVAVRLTSHATLWTRDKRLAKIAETLNVAYLPST